MDFASEQLLAGPRIAAVMVTFNRLERLKNSLPKLISEFPGKILLVDNASTDGTADWLAMQDHPQLEVLLMSENLGGAGGFEAGMERLSAHDDPDWILLLDDDAWPESEAISCFFQTVSDLGPDTGAVAAAVYLPDGRIAEMNRPGYNPFWYPKKIWATLTQGNRAGFKLPDNAYDPVSGPVEIDNASFVGYFVSRSGWRAIGLPEGGLFIYGDDVLYSLRLRRAGLKLIFQPAIRFTHDCGSMDANFVYKPLWKVYYHSRNGVAIARMAAGPLVFPLALLWYVALWERRGRRCRPDERSIYRRMMWSGIWDGLRGKRGREDQVHRLGADFGNTGQPFQ